MRRRSDRTAVACRSLPLLTLVFAASLTAVPPLGVSAPDTVTALIGARVIDGTDRPPIDDATILIEAGRIAAIGAAARIAVPSGAARVSVAGRTIVPGFVNGHGHVGNTNGLAAATYSAASVRRDLLTYAAYGVTTVFSLGDDKAAGFEARDAQRTSTLDRARLLVAGPVLAPKSVADAGALVDADADLKVDIVKIRVDDNLGTTPKMSPAIYRAVIERAHARGLRVAVHSYYLDDAKDVVAAGADIIAHSVRDVDVDAAFIDLLKRRGACYIPTLMRDVSTFVYESTPPWLADPLFLERVDPQVVAALKEPARQEAVRANPAAQRYKAALEVGRRNLKTLSDAGVLIAMGTDSGPPGRFQGYFELLEMELMAKAGLTPRQVLRSATRDAARCMTLDHEVGTLEPGKWADFVVLDGDPLASISNVKRINAVWIAGNRLPD